MLTEVNTEARFLPNRKFRFTPKSGTRASRTAGCNRIGCGHVLQVFCGILISVMLGSAGIACPCALTELKILVDDTAGGTSLTRWKPTVSYDNRTVSEWCLVAKLPTDFRHCRVRNGLGKSDTGHSLDTQVFDPDPSEVIHQASREFVRHISADISNPLVQMSKFCLCLAPVLASLRSPRQLFVESPQPGFVSPKRAWRFDSPSIGQDGKIDDSAIHPNYCLGFAAMRIRPSRFVYFNLNRDVPMVCMLDKSSGKNLSWESENFAHSYPSEFWNAYLAAIEAEFTGVNGKTLTTSLFLFELGIARFFPNLHSSEEMIEGVAEIGQCCVGDFPREFAQPRKFVKLLGIQLGVEFLPRWLLAGGVKFLPSGETPIVSKTGRARTAGQPCCLGVIRIEPDSMRKDGHEIRLSTIKSRITWDIEQRRRLASASIHAFNSGSRWTVTARRLVFFFMPVEYHHVAGIVKIQIRGCLVNGYQTAEVVI